MQIPTGPASTAYPILEYFSLICLLYTTARMCQMPPQGWRSIFLLFRGRMDRHHPLTSGCIWQVTPVRVDTGGRGCSGRVDTAPNVKAVRIVVHLTPISGWVSLNATGSMYERRGRVMPPKAGVTYQAPFWEVLFPAPEPSYEPNL